MSPLSLRRYRADRLLRSEFEGLRTSVVAGVRARLARSGVVLDDADLEVCYAQAWQGLYAAVLDGEEIASPGGWLVTVCFRRALDEHRSRGLPGRTLAAREDLSAGAVGSDGDFASTLDDRDRLRRLMEGIGASMSQREREAASLCFLQGLSRAEAARAMGIAPRRFERLMDGRGSRSPGVAAKLGTLAETIAAGRFCEERASSMRALAFGMLDPDGERHRFAVAHQRSCPACRAYVLQLRGLAAALPPVLLPGLFAAAGLGAEGVNGSRTARPRGRLLRSLAKGRHGGGFGRKLAQARAALGRAATPGSAAGSASTGPAGLSSALAAKLAVVGLAAAGLGTGAVVLSSSGHGAGGAHAAVSRAAREGPSRGPQPAALREAAPRARGGARTRGARHARGAKVANASLRRGPSADAQLLAIEPAGALVLREFGFERRAARSAGRADAAGVQRDASAAGSAARTSPASEAAAGTATPTAAVAEAEEPREGGSGGTSTTSAHTQALREFGIE